MRVNTLMRTSASFWFIHGKGRGLSDIPQLLQCMDRVIQDNLYWFSTEPHFWLSRKLVGIKLEVEEKQNGLCFMEKDYLKAIASAVLLTQILDYFVSSRSWTGSNGDRFRRYFVGEQEKSIHWNTISRWLALDILTILLCFCKGSLFLICHLK